VGRRDATDSLRPHLIDLAHLALPYL